MCVCVYVQMCLGARVCRCVCTSQGMCREALSLCWITSSIALHFIVEAGSPTEPKLTNSGTASQLALEIYCLGLPRAGIKHSYHTCKALIWVLRI